MDKPSFSLCVYCGSKPGNSPEFAQIATQVGTWIGAHGGQLVYGGGRNGLMGLVAEAAVVGRPDDLTGEAICAFVVLKRPRPTGEEAKKPTMGDPVTVPAAPSVGAMLPTPAQNTSASKKSRKSAAANTPAPGFGN